MAQFSVEALRGFGTSHLQLSVKVSIPGSAGGTAILVRPIPYVREGGRCHQLNVPGVCKAVAWRGRMEVTLAITDENKQPEDNRH